MCLSCFCHKPPTATWDTNLLLWWSSLSACLHTGWCFCSFLWQFVLAYPVHLHSVSVFSTALYSLMSIHASKLMINYHSVRLIFCSCWQDWIQKEMWLRKNQLFLPYWMKYLSQHCYFLVDDVMLLNVKCLHLGVVLVMSMLIGVVIWMFPSEYCSLCFKCNLRFYTLSVITFITYPCLWLVNKFLFSVFVFDLILIINHLLFSCLKFPTARSSFWNGWNG